MFTIDASDLPRLMQCNGSRLMAPSYPPALSDNATRDEGLAAHYMALMAFIKRHTLEEMVDRKAPNGVYMTAEMSEHVYDFLASIDEAGEMEVETGYVIGRPNSLDIVGRVNGRADWIYYNAFDLLTNDDGIVWSEPDTLHIFDFKYGWRLVEPDMNWTLISHAIGYSINKQIQPKKIVLTIHQPRPYHHLGKIRSWEFTWEQLLQFWTQIQTTINAPADVLQTGAACVKCHAFATCPAARKAELNAIEASETVFSDQIDNKLLSFTLDQLTRAQSIVEGRIKALQELGLHRLASGQLIDNYSAEKTWTNRQWKDGVDASMIKALFGVDPYLPAKTKSPAQIEKAGIAKDIVNLYAESKQSGTKLARINAQKKAKKLLGEKEKQT